MQLTTREIVAATLARDLDGMPVDKVAYMAKRLHATASIVRDVASHPGSDGIIKAAIERAGSALRGTGWEFDASKPAAPRIHKGSMVIELRG